MKEDHREKVSLPPPVPSKQYYSFKLAFLALGIVLIPCLVADHLIVWNRISSPGSIAALAILGLLAATSIVFAKHVYKLTTTYHFAVAVILVTSVAVILGTLIIQQAPDKVYVDNYGNDFPSLFRLLRLTDIFHSLWFNSLLVLMSVSLLLVLVKRKFYRHASQWGFFLSHVGIVIILVGALVGAIGGGKWFLPMHIGETHTRAYASDNTQLDLGFAVKLDDFRVDFYDEGRKIDIFRAKDGRFVKSVKLRKTRDAVSIPGTDISFKVVNADAKAQKIPVRLVYQFTPERHILKGAGKQDLVVEVGKTYPLDDGRQVTILQFLHHFSYIIENKRAENASNEPLNPALLVKIVRGSEVETMWLFAFHPDYGHNEGHSHGARGKGTGVELEIASTAGKSRAFLEESVSHEENVPLYLDDGNVVMILTDLPDVKDYWSTLSIWENGKQVRQKTIELNDPLEHKGYMFYQSSWKRNDLAYSSIQVVKDPGLWIVYVGLIMICLGVAYVFYVRPKLLKNRAREIAEGASHV